MTHGWLLVVSVAGVAAMLAALSYGSISDYAEYRVGSAPYAAIYDAEPVFEPHIVEPLLDPPDPRQWRYPWDYPYGYSRAEHVPEDDSILLEFEDPGGTGKTHVQTFMPGQTFAYKCYNHAGGTEVHLYQYTGTVLFREARSMTLVQFMIDIPEDLPCIFPDYLRYMVDVYDVSGFDQYGMGGHGPPETGDYNHTTYTDPIRRAVIITPMHVDPFPTSRSAGDAPFNWGGVIDDIVLLPDGSINVAFSDYVGNSTYTYRSNYSPGQTFAVGCTEGDGATLVHLYDYRGTAEFRSEMLVFVTFGAHTRTPMPCTYPDFVIHSTDAFDTSWFDEQYEDRLRHITSVRGGQG